MGGLVRDRSTLGGAAFHLEFPIVKSGGGLRLSGGSEPPSAVRPPPPQFSARVLVLDDEQFIADLLSEMLGVLGHRPVVCLSPVGALDMLQSSPFDLVISDFRMPVMNGEQFYHALANINPDLARRVIFLTGDVVNEETQQFLTSTGNPHLDKPFQLTRLEAVIAEVLSAPIPAAA